MNTIASYAEAVLHSAPDPALRLGELLRLLAPKVGPSVGIERLRHTLERHPEHFRILEALHGPWRVPEENGADDAWVIAVRSPDTPPPDEPPPALRLRESVRWVGLGMDCRSRLEASRWGAIVRAEREARRAVGGRAA